MCPVHVYVNGSWVQAILDQASNPEAPLVAIQRQVALAPSSEQFFVREPQLAMLVSYVRRLGLRRVVRKVRSRRSEALRNDTWLSVGVGHLHGDPSGRPVAFVLPTGPIALERAVVHRNLLFELPVGELEMPPIGHFVPHGPAAPAASMGSDAAQELLALAGWRPEAGPAPVVSATTWVAIIELARRPGHDFAETPPRPPESEPRDRFVARTDDRGHAGRRPSYHCFGFGQYAKTQVIPNLGTRLALACVHEIDPCQIGPVVGQARHSWDTSPRPREGDPIENAVVASFHHTHAPIAVELLDRGVTHVVIEKPIATSTSQLDELLAALDRNPSAKVHGAFQRRYSPFNDYLRQDLVGPAISMAATVYEVPLPRLHWYRWAVSGNSIVSNGCHWIDHFLFINDFSRVSGTHVEKLATQVLVSLELDNGASAAISLRHAGAPRGGVRDHCVFWSDDASVVIDDGFRYTAERGYRQVRRARIHPFQAHESMYREFARRIEADQPGDDPRTIEESTRTVLHLAGLLDETSERRLWRPIKGVAARADRSRSMRTPPG